jgi:small subunit ribosomal protein S8
MTMQDPISDLLTRIRNAQQANHPEVSIPASKLKVAICEVLEQEGYIEGFQVAEGGKPTLTVALRYHRGRPVIEEIKRVSRPGLRSYKGSDALPKVRGGLGVSIVSTNKGVMTDRDAKAQGVGGEVLCTVF